MIEVWRALATVTALLLLLFLPGFCWSFLLARGEDIRWPVRLLMSLGLSLVIMPLTVFWLNLATGVPVTVVSLLSITLAMSLVPMGYLAWRRAHQ